MPFTFHRSVSWTQMASRSAPNRRPLAGAIVRAALRCSSIRLGAGCPCAAVLMPSPTTGGSTPCPGTTGSTTAQTEWTELTTIAGGIEPNNNAQHLRSRWWPVCPSSTSLVRCAGRCNGGREGSVGRARVAHVHSALCGSIPVGVDSLRGFHTGPTAGAQYIGEGSGNGDQGGCEAD